MSSLVLIPGFVDGEADSNVARSCFVCCWPSGLDLMSGNTLTTKCGELQA
jgi:hypothetical protein